MRKGNIFLLLSFICFSSFAQPDLLPKEDTISLDTIGVVYIEQDSIFTIYFGSGDLNVRERAAWISQKLSDLAEKIEIKTDSLYISRQGSRVWIFYNGSRLFAISDEEARSVGLEAEVLAEQYRKIIYSKLKKEAWWENFQTGLLRALAAIGATLILLLFYHHLNKWYRKLFLLLAQKRESWFKGLSIKQTTLLAPNRQMELAKWLLKTLKWFLIILFGYLYLPIVFSIFPWTRGLADKLFGYVLTPLGKSWNAFTDYLPNVFTIAVIIFIAIYINKFFKYLAGEIKAGNLEISGFYRDWADTTYKLINIFIVVFTVTVIWPYIPGSSSDAFKGISIFVGVLFSLGSTGAISNIVSGTVITYMRPFEEGDRVRIADTAGIIIEKSLLVTRIKTPKNVIITVPNSMILGSHIINYSNAAKNLGVVLHTNVTIGYDIPWQSVQEQLIAAAHEVEGLLKTPEPFVLQKALSDFYVDYELNAYTKQPERMEQIYSILHQKIQDKFNEAGIEILSPHYGALRDGNQTTIPPGYLGKDYKAPSFRVEEQKSKPD